MDGVELCKKIKAQSPHTEVVFMSGFYREMDEKEKEFIAAGGRSFNLYKPFPKERIIEVVKAIVSSTE